ncbi:hypothetical protein M878_44795 [Streptomyces roseochromogenus subsp. oscitans DS 12.976]|uniref:Uncharacterized protein n=1 Tax=Streptomyces roseochromogenus subsp. oscitans DS 12.976 TaxID=1352936 RepID=V6JNN2_STRRC|nr:hypothetical protein M878_44795 [Streptomyces roseochromogenus subsp. oscitans DS 12.976]
METLVTVSRRAQSRWALREVGCPLLRDVLRVMRLVMSVIAAQVISDSE